MFFVFILHFAFFVVHYQGDNPNSKDVHAIANFKNYKGPIWNEKHPTVSSTILLVTLRLITYCDNLTLTDFTLFILTFLLPKSMFLFLSPSNHVRIVALKLRCQREIAKFDRMVWKWSLIPFWNVISTIDRP